MPKSAPTDETFQCPFCAGTLWVRPDDVLHSSPPCRKFRQLTLAEFVAALDKATKPGVPS